MLENGQAGEEWCVALFVCLRCATCNPAVLLIEECARPHPDIVVEIPRGFQRPEQIVWLGITCGRPCPLMARWWRRMYRCGRWLIDCTSTRGADTTEIRAIPFFLPHRVFVPYVLEVQQPA